MTGKKTLVFVVAAIAIVAVMILAAYSYSIPLLAYALISGGLQVGIFYFLLGWLERLESKSIDTTFAAARNAEEVLTSEQNQKIANEIMNVLGKIEGNLKNDYQALQEKKNQKDDILAICGITQDNKTKRGKPKKELSEDDKERIARELKYVNN